MEPWVANFAAKAEAMRSAETVTAKEGLEGTLTWLPEKSCTYGCQNGVVYGNGIDIGEFFRVGDAEYCPTCRRTVLLRRTNVIFEPTSFLSAVSQKVKAGVNHRYLSDKGICPKCGKTTKVLTEPGKAKGQTNTWRVCQHCSWPGEHKVTGI